MKNFFNNFIVPGTAGLLILLAGLGFFAPATAQTGPRVGQLVVSPGSQTVYLVGSNGLYGFPSPDVFYSWGYNFGQVLPASSVGTALQPVAVVLSKPAGCDSPLSACGSFAAGLGFGNVSGSGEPCGGNTNNPKTCISGYTCLPVPSSNLPFGDVGGICVANSSSLPVPRVDQLVVIAGSPTVYLVGSDGLHPFSSADIFYSWGYNFAQVVPANSAEIALTVGALVPGKLAGCSNPFDEIAGNCSGGQQTLTVISPSGGEQWAVGSTQIIKWSATSTVGMLNISLSPYVACLYSNPRCMIAEVNPYPIAAGVPNMGGFSWTVSAAATDGRAISPGQYMLNISSADGSLSATSPSPFTITSSTITVAGTPAISSLSPSSGPVGTIVTVNGSRFTQAGNSVLMRGYSVADGLTSPDGKTLQFSVPATLAPHCSVNTACPQFIISVIGGDYPIMVTNANGASNVVTFTVAP